MTRPSFTSNCTRWTWLLVLLVGCSSNADHAKTPIPVGEGRVEPFAIGSLDAYAVSDGYLEMPNDGESFVLERPPTEVGDLLASAGLPHNKLRLDLQCLLVKAGERVLLFDTGVGAFSTSEPMLAHTGHLAKSLALAHVEAAAITDIFISHAHSDHVGGLVTASGALAFPSATIHISAPEWAQLQETSTSDADKRFVATIAPRVSAFTPGTPDAPSVDLVPLVRAVATLGHTPGHSSYAIGSGADTLFYLGDVAHHSVISVLRPAWTIQFDHDHEAGKAMRQQTLAKLAADHQRVFAGHFPFPGSGHFDTTSSGIVWKPEPR